MSVAIQPGLGNDNGAKSHPRKSQKPLTESVLMKLLPVSSRLRAETVPDTFPGGEILILITAASYFVSGVEICTALFRPARLVHLLLRNDKSFRVYSSRRWIVIWREALLERAPPRRVFGKRADDSSAVDARHSRNWHQASCNIPAWQSGVVRFIFEYR